MSTMRVGVILNGSEALACYRNGVGDAAAWPKPIPDGCNTAWERFADADGRPALLIRQSGFRRQRGEPEVNGMSVLVALDGTGESAYAALEAFVAQMLDSP